MEYNNTVYQLLGDTSSPADAFPPDEEAAGFDNQAAALVVSPLLAEHYMGAAEALSSAHGLTLMGQQMPTCVEPGLDPDSCRVEVEAFIHSFGKRAYRRPMTNEEVAVYLDIFDEGTTLGESDYAPDVGVEMIMEGMLQSPHFLYRVEFGMADPVEGDVVALTSYEVASRQIGGPGDDYGFGVDVDGNGDIVIAGRFQETIDIAGQLVSAGGRDIYLAKLNSFGVPQWGKRFGGAGEDGAHDLRVQQNGNIVVLGFMAETMNFGGPNLVSAGMRDIFLATLDQAGDHLWSHNYGDDTDQFSFAFESFTWMSLALDDSGAIHIGGSLIGGANFGGPDLASADEDPDIFYVKLAANGDYLAGNRYGGIATDIALDIAVAGTGHIVLAGRSFGSSIDFGPAGSLVGYGSSDGLLVKKLP